MPMRYLTTSACKLYQAASCLFSVLPHFLTCLVLLGLRGFTLSTHEWFLDGTIGVEKHTLLLKMIGPGKLVLF